MAIGHADSLEEEEDEEEGMEEIFVERSAEVQLNE